MNIIEKYKFGKMVINGKSYTSDLIIFTDSIETNWRRKKGHSLHLKDLEILMEKEIETLVVGSGMFGLVDIPEELIKELNAKEITVIIEKSTQAMKKFNELAEKGVKVAGAFHLNC
ncbi:MAG: hypothetical protein GOP50_03190 [Candidatus Heimdallarchaeota archaeon]|nr:hypothetical protein [Candidatus Heimdallarchaeota archaeon]